MTERQMQKRGELKVLYKYYSILSLYCLHALQACQYLKIINIKTHNFVLFQVKRQPENYILLFYYNNNNNNKVIISPFGTNNMPSWNTVSIFYTVNLWQSQLTYCSIYLIRYILQCTFLISLLKKAFKPENIMAQTVPETENTEVLMHFNSSSLSHNHKVSKCSIWISQHYSHLTRLLHLLSDLMVFNPLTWFDLLWGSVTVNKQFCFWKAKPGT